MQASQSSTASGEFDRSGQRTLDLSTTHHCHSDLSVNGQATSVASTAEGPGLAHDAGNLLAALSLYSDLLALPGVLSEEYRGYAAELRHLSNRSSSLIDRLVNHAHRQSGPRTGTSPVVLLEVVERCRGLLDKVIGRPVDISHDASALHSVNVSEEAIERILTNLVKNAAESMPKDGVISVRVEGRSDNCDACGEGSRRRIVMTVSDSGCGMSNATVRRLQGAGTITRTRGRGLGFRVVRELVAMSGGCLSIDSRLGVGTRVTIEWYVASDAMSGVTCASERCHRKKPQRHIPPRTVKFADRRNGYEEAGGTTARRDVGRRGAS